MGKKVDLNRKNTSRINNMPHNKRNYYNRSSSYSANYSPEDNEINQEENYGQEYSNSASNINNHAKINIKFPLPNKALIIATLIISFSFIFLMLFVTLFSDEDDGAGSGVTMGGYYTAKCDEITVIYTNKNNNYEVTGSGNFSLDDYVAGVVYAEVGGANNKEIYKVFALAARTYVLTHDNDCTIESSDRRQVFKDITQDNSATAQLIYEAVNETSGQVLLSNNELTSVHYDAFCSIDKDENYYTIKQQNQKIPVSWVDSQSGIAESWKKGDCSGNHGMGISQWGSYYLAKEKGYTAEEILQYYLGDDEITISTKSYMTSIANLETKNTTNANVLTTPLNEFLPANGSSIAELNSYIKNSVIESGAGTREGVVTAAVSLINYLYDNYQVRIPYYWGGEYQNYGVSGNFGGQAPIKVTPYGTMYNYYGFDCSGFVSWAIKNGGYRIERKTTQGFHTSFSVDSCIITDSTCFGQPGDLINSKNSHVQLIIAADTNNNKYMIAESTGSKGLIIREWDMHKGNALLQETRILHMDSFYNNKGNIDLNY